MKHPKPPYCFMTYNIRKGKGANRGHPELHEIIQQIQVQQPDILLCQEVAQYHGESPQKQDEHFAALLDMHHCYAPNAFFEHRNHGNACYSKLPISCHTNFNVSTNIFERRGILLSELMLPHTTLFVFNVHFGLTPMQRRLQAKALETLIHQEVPPESPIIVAGDFNDISGWVDRHLQKTEGFKSALADLDRNDRMTWSSRNPVLALDRIYYRHLTVHSVEVLKGALWETLSDHLPLKMLFSV